MERSIWIVTTCPFVPLLIDDMLNKLEVQVYRGTCAALSWKPNIWAQCVLRVPPGARCQVLCAKCQVTVPKCLVTGGTNHQDETEKGHFGNCVARDLFKNGPNRAHNLRKKAKNSVLIPLPKDVFLRKLCLRNYSSRGNVFK